MFDFISAGLLLKTEILGACSGKEKSLFLVLKQKK
jgi:hypothetical protein